MLRDMMKFLHLLSISINETMLHQFLSGNIPVRQFHCIRMGLAQSESIHPIPPSKSCVMRFFLRFFRILKHCMTY